MRSGWECKTQQGILLCLPTLEKGLLGDGVGRSLGADPVSLTLFSITYCNWQMILT